MLMTALQLLAHMANHIQTDSAQKKERDRSLLEQHLFINPFGAHSLTTKYRGCNMVNLVFEANTAVYIIVFETNTTEAFRPKYSSDFELIRVSPILYSNIKHYLCKLDFNRNIGVKQTKIEAYATRSRLQTSPVLLHVSELYCTVAPVYTGESVVSFPGLLSM